MMFLTRSLVPVLLVARLLAVVRVELPGIASSDLTKKVRFRV